MNRNGSRQQYPIALRAHRNKLFKQLKSRNTVAQNLYSRNLDAQSVESVIKLLL